jgi:hypothetical protein
MKINKFLKNPSYTLIRAIGRFVFVRKLLNLVRKIKNKAMEKINSTFWFVNSYTDNNEKEQQATVVLEIDYIAKNFTVKPFCGSVSGFTFVKSSHKYKMWKALLKGIEQAIDFANGEIGVS